VRRDFGHGLAPCRAISASSAARFRAPVRTALRVVIGRRGTIPGAGVHRAARLLCGAVRSRVRVCAALRGHHAAQRSCWRWLAPHCVVIAQPGAISGAGLRCAARQLRGSTRFQAQVRAAPRGSTRFWVQVRAAPRDNRAAQHDSGRGSAPRRAVAYIPVYLYVHFIFQHIPSYSCTFQQVQYIRPFVEHIGIC